MMKLNRSEMRNLPRGSDLQWFTAEFGLLNIDVYDGGNRRWYWRVTSLVTTDSGVGYLSKDVAYAAAIASAVSYATDCLQKLMAEN